MASDKIPVAVDFVIRAFSGTGITEYASGIFNGIIQKLGDVLEVTQRPSIDVFGDAESASGLNDRGRGIYYWEHNNTLYFVEDDTVYRDDYSTTVGTISSGTERVEFHEANVSGGGEVLIITDAENNNAFKITTANVFSSHSPTNFPTTLCQGGAVLDGYLFLMDEDGIIYNSAVGDVDTFPAAGFITAERNHDKGVYLGRHRESVVALGTRTIEFFYDAANSVGSPLNRRADIFHNIGCADGVSVWENGDIIYFVGSDPSGSLGVYKIENYNVTKVSTDTIDSYINHNITQESFRMVGSGLNAQGHLVYTLTLYNLPGAASTSPISPEITLSFDTFAKLWGVWSTTINGHTTFPLVSWTKRTGGFNESVRARAGEGILTNGDLITLGDNMVPIDTILGFTGYFVSGYIDSTYFVAAAPDVTSNVALKVRTGMYDGGINKLKFQNSIKPTYDETPTSQTLTLQWSTSAEQEGTFTTGRSLDTSKRDIARRGGKFTRRNYQLSYSGDEQLYLQDLDIDVNIGDY